MPQGFHRRFTEQLHAGLLQEFDFEQVQLGLSHLVTVAVPSLELAPNCHVILAQLFGQWVLPQLGCAWEPLAAQLVG